jgi:hypothetical protein
MRSIIILNITNVIKSRRMTWAEYLRRMGDMRNIHKILVGKPERKRFNKFGIGSSSGLW